MPRDAAVVCHAVGFAWPGSAPRIAATVRRQVEGRGRLVKVMDRPSGKKVRPVTLQRFQQADKLTEMGADRKPRSLGVAGLQRGQDLPVLV